MNDQKALVPILLVIEFIDPKIVKLNGKKIPEALK